jgi:phosphoglycerate dehydrogenase-like enzyme
MKQSSVFINTGMGINLIVPDLLEALENKTIAGAVLDVFQKEPLSQDSELWQTDNLYITPHISGYTNDFDTIISAFTDNYYLFINGKQLNNIIDLNK